MKNVIPNHSSRLMPAATVALTLLLLGGSLRAESPESYRKQWRDPAVNDRIDRNIEKYRKGDAVVEVVDATGKPIGGAKVELRQTGHEFLFGCNAFVLGQLKPSEMNQRYEESFLKLFNFATIPFYWAGIEPTKGELRYAEPARDIWRRPTPDRFVPWAAKHNVTLKGHPLLWHAHNPDWLPKDPAELKELYCKRFQEISSRFGDKVPIWEVANESQVCPKTYPLYDPERAYVAWAFQQAAKYFPADRFLMINEVTEYNFKLAEKNSYFAQVKSLLAQGLKVQGIGLQYHFFRRKSLDGYLAGSQSDPVKLMELYEKFSEFGLPLFITEITIPSAGDAGEELQAEVVRDLYRLWFSAPTMAGITWWNLGDGTAVQGENEAQGGLMDGQLQPKAAYRVLDKLINTEWKSQATSQTDAQGVAQLRGFFGAYTVTVESGGKTTTQTFQLKKGAPNKWTVKF